MHYLLSVDLLNEVQRQITTFRTAYGEADMIQDVLGCNGDV